MSRHACNYLMVGALLGIFGLLSNHTASALTYQQDIGVNFTFNTALRLTLSSSDIHIYNLAPGTASDSNIINVNVSTNSVSGYTLNATVGNSTTYNTRNLLHTNSNISDNFTSIDYTSTPTITTNTNLGTDKWAFSFSTDNGTNWSNYNGLPLYSDTTNIATLKETNGPVSTEQGDDIKFKIAAKASDTKPSGDYSNVINFTLVAAPNPTTLFDAFQAAGKQQLYGYYKMQDMSSNICDLVEAVDEQLQVIDVRDGKTYWIAKLRDGKCWMTQNLDLDLDTNKTLTHADTDLGWGSVIDATATWTPIHSTTTVPHGDMVTWQDFDNYGWGYVTSAANTMEAASLNPDDLYWSGDLVSNDIITEFAQTVDNEECIVEDWADCMPWVPWAYYNAGVSSGNEHYSLGNYYNVLAAYAKDDYSYLINNTNFSFGEDYISEESICPAGWRLPNESNNAAGDFENLLSAYNIQFTSRGTGGWWNNVLPSNTSEALALTRTPFYLSLSGSIDREGNISAPTGVAKYAYLISNTSFAPSYLNELSSNGLFAEVEDLYSDRDAVGSSVAASIRCVAR